MTYQLSSIVSKVQQRVSDTAYSSAEIIGYINDVQNDIFNEYRFDFMKKKTAYTVTIGDEDITSGNGLPTDYVEAISLMVTTPGQEQELEFIDEDDLEALYPAYDTQANGQPLYAYFSEGTINLYPAPDAAYTLRLRYYRKPVELEDSADVPELPSEFEEIYVSGGAYKVLQAKQAYDEAGIHENKYAEILQKLYDKFIRQPASGPAIMKVNKIGYALRNTSRRVDSYRRIP